MRRLLRRANLGAVLQLPPRIALLRTETAASKAEQAENVRQEHGLDRKGWKMRQRQALEGGGGLSGQTRRVGGVPAGLRAQVREEHGVEARGKRLRAGTAVEVQVRLPRRRALVHARTGVRIKMHETQGLQPRGAEVHPRTALEGTKKL